MKSELSDIDNAKNKIKKSIYEYHQLGTLRRPNNCCAVLMSGGHSIFLSHISRMQHTMITYIVYVLFILIFALSKKFTFV